MNHHHYKEANAMFRICTLVRDQLRKELDAGESYEVVGQRLKAFYQVTSPKVLAALEKATPVDQMSHLGNVLQCSILLVLDDDESIDFQALRAFLTKTWPDMDVEEAITPSKPLFTTISGKEVCADPSFRVLLEKVGPDWTQQSSPKLQELLKADGGGDDQVIDRSIDVQAALYRYHTSLVHMCECSSIHFGMEWLHFETFRAWAMENGYKVGLRLERKILSLGYVPGNVSWQERRFRQSSTVAASSQSTDINVATTCDYLSTPKK